MKCLVSGDMRHLTESHWISLLTWYFPIRTQRKTDRGQVCLHSSTDGGEASQRHRLGNELSGRFLPARGDPSMCFLQYLKEDAHQGRSVPSVQETCGSEGMADPQRDTRVVRSQRIRIIVVSVSPEPVARGRRLYPPAYIYQAETVSVSRRNAATLPTLAAVTRWLLLTAFGQIRMISESLFQQRRGHAGSCNRH
ncbi:unnamed protein product [Rangifer tarandus platyrhynchus]|uniref:Uncharacterized protein n=1 Tax=Rangifer tarandus platyrhynchus TaxID=3082113 RepID=A0ABN8XJL5_RANTA|nr:unnamed protein product [Rangifer tarandus platyrhynchus]